LGDPWTLDSSGEYGPDYVMVNNGWASLHNEAVSHHVQEAYSLSIDRAMDVKTATGARVVYDAHSSEVEVTDNGQGQTCRGGTCDWGWLPR
jgi:hypothetical protein